MTHECETKISPIWCVARINNSYYCMGCWNELKEEDIAKQVLKEAK